MPSAASKRVAVVTVAAMAFGLLAMTPRFAPTAVPVVNGGFEEWEQAPPERAIPDGWRPRGWQVVSEYHEMPDKTGIVARDRQVACSGKHSVRLSSTNRAEVTAVAYSTESFAANPQDPRNLRPDRRYLVRWRVKGENVDNSTGPGTIMMLYVSGQRDGQRYRVDHSLALSLSGSFDWQEQSFHFITDQHAAWAVFNLQLRWVTGTVWYDDFELIDLGPVLRVKTF